MQRKAFDEMLEEKRRSPFAGFDPSWGTAVSKYQHIERLGNTAAEGLLDGDVSVQTKLDGANLTVCFVHTVGIVIASRNQVISINEEPHHGFNGAIQYVLAHSGIRDLCARYILRGEWMAPHSISYNKNTMNHFFVFDVQEYVSEKYLTPDEYEPILRTYGINYIPVLAKLNKPDLPQLIDLVTGPDDFGAKQKEGIVIKRYDFVNRFGRQVWGKLVSADFKEKNKLAFGGTKKDPAELRFVARTLTKEKVLKIIEKIKDRQEGEISIKSMSEILQRSWYDVFTENLWDFVKKEKVKEFNFDSACKMATKKTREIALEYFNGL